MEESSLLKGYKLAIKHFKERLEAGQSFEEAIKDIEELSKKI